MPTLAYHEAIPGHHFQIALAQEMENLPSFRQGLIFTAYTEGWALYTEQLVAELDWYVDNPYGMLGMLQAQAFRPTGWWWIPACTPAGGLSSRRKHSSPKTPASRWATAFDPQQQIARYLVWPGQATSYYIGYLKFMELRQRAMDQLGDQFDLKEFHRVVLSNGSMPLDILESVVNRYISSKSSP